MATDKFGEKWAAALEDIGIFPTEKIYGKDIQTPFIGIEPGEEGFDWGKITPRTEEEEREIEEAQRKARERERIKREKEKYGGVTLEEYQRRIQAGWKFNPRGGVAGEGKWISPRLAAPAWGAPARKVSPEEEKYPELAAFEEQINKLMRSKEFMALSEMEKYPIYQQISERKTKITDKIKKEETAEKLAQEKAEQALPQEYIVSLINAANEGQINKGAVAYILAGQGMSDDYIDNITAGIKEPMGALDKIKLDKLEREEREAGRIFPREDVNGLNAEYRESGDRMGLAAGLYSLNLTDEQVDELLPVKLNALEKLEVKQLQGTVEEEAEDRRIKAELRKIYPEMVLEGWSYDSMQELKLKYLEYEEKVKAGEREQGRDDLNDYVQRETLTQNTKQATIKQQNWVTERQDKLDAAKVKKEQWTEEFGAERAQELFDNEMTTLDYLEKVRAAQSNEEITKDRDLMNYEIAGIKEEHSWTQALHTMGLKDKEFIQSAYEFMQTMDYNKTKEQTRAREFGQTYRLDVAQEAGIQNRFEKSLEKEYADLNVQIEKLGLAREVETRLAQTAAFTAMMEIKNFGLAEAKQRLEEIKARKEWIFKERYWQLDSEEAELAMFKTMSDIYNDAAKVGIEQAILNANIANMENTLEFKYKELEQKALTEGTGAIEITSDLSVTLANMSPEIQNDVTRMIRTVYDEKKGFYHPSDDEMVKIAGFLFGRTEGETRPEERFGVNLNEDEFIRGCVGEFDWSDQMKGWCITTRDKDYMWESVIAAGVAKGIYISPEIEEAIKKTGWFETGVGGTFRKIGETFKNWFTFTEPVAPGIEPTTRVTRTGNIATDAENILTQYGEEISRSDMRKHLSDMGYSEVEINSVLGG